MRRILIFVAAVLWTSACSSVPTATPPATDSAAHRPAINSSPLEAFPSISAGQLAYVQRVVDGDTFIALIGSSRIRIRLIGVNTPETVKPNSPVECYGPEASAYAKHILTGKKVHLVYDVDRYDRYGRTLAYVYLGAIFFNLSLVQQGYAVVETVPPDVAHVDDFLKAQRAARASRLGLWLKCMHQ